MLQPTGITVSDGGRTVTIAFESGPTISLSAARLRQEDSERRSPLAERRGPRGAGRRQGRPHRRTRGDRQLRDAPDLQRRALPRRPAFRRGRARRSDGGDQAGRDGVEHFVRGVSAYPAIGDSARIIGVDELRLIYRTSGARTIDIGALHHDRRFTRPSTSTICSASTSPSSARPASASRAASRC